MQEKALLHLRNYHICISVQALPNWIAEQLFNSDFKLQKHCLKQKNRYTSMTHGLISSCNFPDNPLSKILLFHNK